MSLRSGLRVSILSILSVSISLLASQPGMAADQDGLIQQMTSLNSAAITDYGAGDFDKAKSRLMEAVAIGKKDTALQTHPMMARTYVHLGVLFVDGLEDRKAGIRYFQKALEIRPEITVTEEMSTKTVRSAFEEAGGGKAAAATATKAPDEKEAPAAKEAPVKALSAKEEKAARLAAAKEEKAAKEQAAKDEKAARLAAAKEEKAAKEQAAKDEKAAREQDKQAEKALAAEKKRADAEAKEKDRQAQDEKDKLMKQLAQSEGNEAKERAAKEKLSTEKQERERALTESKTLVVQLQKELTEKEKQSAAEKDKLQKDLALTKDAEAKERAAKEKALAEKADRDKQLADAKNQILQLQKEKADREKQLAETSGREKKERESKEKLEKDRLAAEARDKERKAQEESARAAKEKLAAGPDVPSHFSEAVYCTVPDEAEAGQDLFVHCVAQPSVKAKELAIYYRAGGVVHYNSLSMEPGKKGWRAAVIPGNHVTGKSIQYYVEARDAKGSVAALNGKPTSPNILSLRAANSGVAVGQGSGKREASLSKKR